MRYEYPPGMKCEMPTKTTGEPCQNPVNCRWHRDMPVGQLREQGPSGDAYRWTPEEES
jgi:hypothetical protein